MNKPNLILHIGAHKTGTSYIQKVLSDNMSLLAKNKVIYPKKWKNILWGHHELVLDLCGQNYNPKELLDYITSFPKDSTIIFSSENFESIDAHSISNLESIKEVANVKVVYFYRHFQDLAYSLWQESVKHGDFKTFPSFLFEYYSRPVQSIDINFSLKLEPYISIFGYENIEIINYNKLREEKIDLADFFLRQVCHVDNFPFDKLLIANNSINESFSSEKVELIRALNYLFYTTKQEKATSALRESFIQALSKREINIDNIIFSYEKKYRLYKDSLPIKVSLSKALSAFIDRHDHFEHQLSQNKDILVVSPDTWLGIDNSRYLHEIFKLININ